MTGQPNPFQVAAATLSDCRQALESLRAERDEWHRSAHHYACEVERLKAELRRVTDQRDRLREHLGHALDERDAQAST